MRRKETADGANMSDTKEQTHSTTQPGTVKSNDSVFSGHNGETGKVNMKACSVVLRDILKGGQSHYAGKTDAKCSPTTTNLPSRCSSPRKTSLQEVSDVRQEHFGREEIYIDTFAPRHELDIPFQEGASCDRDKVKVRVQKVVILATQEDIGGEERTRFTVKLCDTGDCGDTRDCGDGRDYNDTGGCGDMSDFGDTVTGDCTDTGDCGVTGDYGDTGDCGNARNCSDMRYCRHDNDANKNNPKTNKTEVPSLLDVVAKQCTEKTMCPLAPVDKPAVTSDFFNIVSDHNYHKCDKNLTDGKMLHMCQTCGETFLHRKSMKQHNTSHTCVTYFSCSVCGQLFTKRDHMKTHRRRHFKVKGYKCTTVYSNARGDASEATVNWTELDDTAVSVVTHDDAGRETATELTTKLRDTRCLSNDDNGDCSDGEDTDLPDVDGKTCEKKRCSSTPAAKDERNGNTDHNHGKHDKPPTDDERQYLCTTCGESFLHQSSLTQHLALHTAVKSCHSSVSGQLFNRPDSMTCHKLEHSQVIPHKCETCGKEFLSSDHLKVHAHAHMYPCTICGKSFHNWRDCKKHAVIHMPEKPFSCKICGKSYRQIGGLTCHMAKHTGKGSHVCDRCGKSFLHASSLKTHALSHLSEKTFPCSLCHKSFVCLMYLKQHEKLHTGMKLHLCVTCGKSFKSSFHLRRHMKVHTDDKPYSCELCGKAFKVRYVLKTHMLTHTGEKPHTCTVCGTSFFQRQALQVHQRIHTNVKPYTCSVCGKSFVTASQIKTHEKSHSGDKPHACTICGQRFTLPHHRRAHEKTHRNGAKK